MKKAIQAANRLALECDTHDPFEMCKGLGIAVHRRKLLDMRGYYLGLLDVPQISLADDLDGSVLRFVCAHELGHHVFDGGLNRMFMDSRTFMIPDKYENRADAFAIALLFSMFDDADYSVSDWALAECLNVSACNLDSRLVDLGFYK